MGKTAIVFGATGLIGNHLVNELLNANEYDQVISCSRTEIAINHTKHTNIIIDYDHLENYSNKLAGDDVYCCIGSTLRKAGSVRQFYKIDHDIPLQLAKFSKLNGVHSFALVSSIGAKKGSKNYYINTKGEVEEDILELDFTDTIIVRPSLLLGKRNETRISESIWKLLMYPFNFLLFGKLKKYKAIKASDVAKAMIFLANSKKEKCIFESDELRYFAKEYSNRI